MNFRNWGRKHTIGLVIGILSPLIFIPVVILMLSWFENYLFEQLWYKFVNDSTVRAKDRFSGNHFKFDLVLHDAQPRKVGTWLWGLL
jgi:hypothetical protein